MARSERSFTLRTGSTLRFGELVDWIDTIANTVDTTDGMEVWIDHTDYSGEPGGSVEYRLRVSDAGEAS
jgi:hypothetical protein